MTEIIARQGGRPSREQAERIEEQIVDVARDLFFLHGYGATSVETIAKHARISKRTFYHRFQNKAAIFKAVLERLISRFTPGDIEGLFEGGSCEEILRRLAGLMLQASLSPHALALHRLMIAEAIRFPELAAAINEQGTRQEAIARIAALLAQETQAGRLSVDDPALAAELFLQMVIALPQRRAMGLGTPMTPEEVTGWSEQAVRIFLHGCAG